MSGTHSWKALLWKEWRESRGVVATALAVSALTFIVASRYSLESGLRDSFVAVGGLAFTVLVAMWGASKGSVEARRSVFADTHLPLNPAESWLSMFLAPLLVAVAAGAWCGVWSVVVYRENMLGWALYAAVWTGCCFALPYAISNGFAVWSGRLVGVAVAFAGVIEEQGIRGILDLRQQSAMLWLTIAAVLGTILAVALRKRPRLITQATVAALLIGAITPSLWPWLSQRRESNASEVWHRPQRIDSTDWSMYVAPVAPGKLEFGNLRTGLKARRVFSGNAVPIDFRGSDVVYVLQQERGRYVELLTWNARTGTTSQVMRFRAGRGALAPVKGYVEGFVRPDGRYMLVDLRSMAGLGRDLWVIDLVRKRARVAYANAHFASSQVQWFGDHATLSGSEGALRAGRPAVALLVNLPEARASRIRAEDGG